MTEPQAALPAAAGPSLGALVRALRPQQWTKNLPILAPLIFARRLGRPDDLARAALAAVAFCLLSGGIYVFNDLADREKDRLHPEKRHRPIASGALSPAVGAALGALALGGGLALAGWVGLPLLAVCLVYVGLQTAYTLRLKQVVILDVVLVAVGFVLRVIAGAKAIGVPVSGWLYLCTLCLALFLGFCKRRHELVLLGEAASAHRASLGEYTAPLLDQLIGVVTAMTLIAYSLYTMSAETVAKFHTERLEYTIPFVVYGVFRYLFLVYRRAQGGSPERVLLSDGPLIASVVLYAAVAVGVLYGG